MSKILAIDTATEACSAALLNAESLTCCYEVAPQAHTRKILPMCESLLTDAGLTLSELNAIAFGRGPGSFTGVRIGIGIAQGLALGAAVPLIGISNLAVLAQGAQRRHQPSHVFAAIDARMGEIYFGAFVLVDGLMQPLAEEAVLSPEAALAQAQALLTQHPGRWLATGTGFAAYPDLLSTLGVNPVPDTESLPCAEDLIPLAQQALAQGQAIAAELATPVYLRDKVTWKKLPGRE